MLKDRIVELCQLKKITVKKLAIEIGFSEQSMYRWFKEDTLELKHLRKIANYFNVDISYFFDTKKLNGNIQKESISSIDQVSDVQSKYGRDTRDIRDKYIAILEENLKLQKELGALKDRFQDCLSELNGFKTKQPV